MCSLNGVCLEDRFYCSWNNIFQLNLQSFTIYYIWWLVLWPSYCCSLVSKSLYYRTVVLSYCCTIVLLYYRTVVLSYCCTIVLLYYRTVVLSYCCTIVLLYYRTVVLSYYSTIILLIYYYNTTLIHVYIPGVYIMVSCTIVWYYDNIIVRWPQQATIIIRSKVLIQENMMFMAWLLLKVGLLMIVFFMLFNMKFMYMKGQYICPQCLWPSLA